MIFVVFLLIILIVANYRCYISDFNKDYLSKESTTIVNGIFIVLVFLSHFSQYTVLNNAYDKGYMWLRSNMGQLIVAPFLFYSGFGIMCSIKSKGDEYIKKIPMNRIFKTLIHFDIALAFYLSIKIINNNCPPIKHVLQSFLAYKSLGNSDWYIFAMLTMWILTFIVFRFIKSDIKVKLGLVFAAVLLEIYILSTKKPPWWYNTMICYPIGMLYCIYKDKINNFLMKNSNYTVALVLSVSIFCLASGYKKIFFFYEIWVVAFVAIILLLTMKIKIKSTILFKMGSYLFEIYIFMRLPMILLRNGFKGHNYWYLLSCAIITACIAVIMNVVYKKIDSRILDDDKRF